MTTDPVLQRAVGILRAGGLVAFPTETVYGLGADALNRSAVRRVFEVKRRPEGHPLIIHVGRSQELAALARDLPSQAWELARRFWPGPLTLVVRKSGIVPLSVTGGRDTVAVRVPGHPLALALLHAFGGPIAAPSANRFGQVSPTTALHVSSDLGGDVDLILDGGGSEIGVESTIVDLTRDRLCVLRLGGISVEDLEAVVQAQVAVELHGSSAPGQLPSHYAPRAKVLAVTASELAQGAEALRASGARLALLAPAGSDQIGEHDRIEVPKEPEGYARSLYAALRTLDSRSPEVIVVVLPEERGIGRAIGDRVRRAAAPRPKRNEG